MKWNQSDPPAAYGMESTHCRANGQTGVGATAFPSNYTPHPKNETYRVNGYSLPLNASPFVGMDVSKRQGEASERTKTSVCWDGSISATHRATMRGCYRPYLSAVGMNGRAKHPSGQKRPFVGMGPFRRRIAQPCGDAVAPTIVAINARGVWVHFTGGGRIRLIPFHVSA